MAGIDILNQFPNSRMAAAVELGQSRFMSADSVTSVTPTQKTGTATMAAKNGTTSTATLLTLAGLTTTFNTIMFTITTSVAGVAISYGTGPAVVYAQGQTATFQNVSTTANQITVLTALADVVNISYVGV
jgi:hypothetical protein